MNAKMKIFPKLMSRLKKKTPKSIICNKKMMNFIKMKA